VSTRKTLYVVRHGQTEWNLAQRMQGRLDSALTETGRRQADVHGRTLARLGGAQALLVSPLGRTRATAELLNAHLGSTVRLADALMERDSGDWSGLTLAEIEAAHPEQWRARQADPYHHRPPGGENLVDMEGRVAGLLESLLQAPEEVVVLVTHGVMSRVIVKRLANLSAQVAVTVRHPNELFYRLELSAQGDASSAYFIDGQGPQHGLLQHSGDGTFSRQRRQPTEE